MVNSEFSERTDGGFRLRWLLWPVWLVLWAVLAIFAVAAVWSFYLKSIQPEFVLAPPSGEDPEFLALPAPTSHVSIALSVPFENLERMVRGVQANSGGSSVRINGYKVVWQVGGTNAEVRREDSKLLLRGGIGGKLSIDEGAPWVLDILGAEFDLQIGYRILTGLSLREDWALQMNPTVATEVHKALKPAALPIFRVDIRNQIAPHVDRAMKAYVSSFQRDFGPNGIVEQAARQAWSSLCASVPLAPFVRASGTSLQLQPSRLRATPLEIEDDAISLQLRFDLDTRVVAQPTAPSCPFPERLVLEEKRPTPTEVTVPIFVDYEGLRSIANRSLVQHARTGSAESDEDLDPRLARFVPSKAGPFWLHEIRRIEKRGDDLFLSITAYDALSIAQAKSRSDAASDVDLQDFVFTLDMLVEAKHDTATQQISLANFRIDTEAPNALSNTLLEVAEPWILWQIERSQTSYRLTNLQEPLEDALRTAAEAASIDVDLQDFRVTELDFGARSIRALVAATGSVDVSLSPDALTASR